MATLQSYLLLEPVPPPRLTTPPPDAADKVQAAADESELIRAAASVRADGGVRLALGSTATRSLQPDEIARLERQGNTAEDWSRVRVADGFDPARVAHSSFFGDVVLGRFERRLAIGPGLELPAGVYHSTVADSCIGTNALVRDVRLLGNYVVGESAVVFDCGSVCCEAGTAFGNGWPLALGIESGGREVRSYAEIDIEIAEQIARSRDRRELLDRYARAVDAYVARAAAPRGIIERGAIIRHTPQVTNAYVGPHARIDGATRVAGCTLLSNADEPTVIESGACVSHTLLQWGSRVSTLAVVESAVLAEHSHVERHAKVSHSIIGPNSGVGAGEVTASLVGPFVSAHHQSLLIAALWPEGKGNVASGANVGSNHTGKAPDQEIRPGEGVFFGLGVNIKYPSDFSRAPYTLFPCGVSMLPQRLEFPFSLVNTPAALFPGVPPTFNEIIPGWMLSENLYALRRNEAKYQARNRARRGRFTFEVLRPDTVDLMRDACRRLESIRRVQEVYTEKDIDGLGKNYLAELNRQKAIKTYRFFIRFYELLRMKDRLQDGRRRGEAKVTDAAAGLRDLSAMLDAIARSVERSKAKDDERGGRIIADYAAAHPCAEHDAFVQQTWAETRRQQHEIEQLVNAIEPNLAQ